MTTDNLTTTATSFGARLKAAREQMGLEQKDVAAQLRLNEKYINMMESDHFPSDLPITFVRGYLRSYGKFLQIPEWEVKKALEPIQPNESIPEPIKTMKATPVVTSGNYFMQFFTYAIVLTMVGLVGTWWYRHTPNHNNTIAENRPQPVNSVPANSINTLPQTAASATSEALALPPQNPAITLPTPPTLPNTALQQKPAPTVTEAANSTRAHHAKPQEENDFDGDETD